MGPPLSIGSPMPNYRAILAGCLSGVSSCAVPMPLAAEEVAEAAVEGAPQGDIVVSGVRQPYRGDFAVRGFTGDKNIPTGYLVNGFNGGRGFGGPRYRTPTASAARFRCGLEPAGRGECTRYAADRLVVRCRTGRLAPAPFKRV